MPLALNNGDNMNIKITPSPLSGSIEGIASKSVAHRALICACLAKEPSKITINTTSQDIEATVSCLRGMGAYIEQQNNTYYIEPIKDLPPLAKIDCNESGSTLRFLLPVICSLGMNAEISGRGRLPERPISPLKEELIRAGASISDEFPLFVSGKIKNGDYSIRGDVSSQFVTGLLIALSHLDGESRLKLIPPVESRPYIDITLSVLNNFGAQIKEENNTFYINGGGFRGVEVSVEADWSNAAFWLCPGVEVRGLNPDSAQGDKAIIDVLKKMNAEIFHNGNCFKADVSHLKGATIDASDIPDAVPVIAAVAATAQGKTVITNASRLRIKESDRIASTVAMLRSLGADAYETDDGMIITGKPYLSGGTVDSFNDHRIAMAAAVAAAKCKGDVIITDANAVNKSYPDFFKHYNLLGGHADVL